MSATAAAIGYAVLCLALLALLGAVIGWVLVWLATRLPPPPR